MAILEDLKPNSQVKGILPSGPVTILSAQWHGSDVEEAAMQTIIEVALPLEAINAEST